MLHITFSKYDCTIIYQVWVYFHCISITLKLLQNHNYNYMTSCIGVLMLHITFSKYDCIIVHKAYYVLTCTCVSINSFHSHSHIFPSTADRAISHIQEVTSCVYAVSRIAFVHTQ